MSTGILSRAFNSRKEQSSGHKYLPGSGAEVQNVQNSKIYVFGDNQVSECDIEENGSPSVEMTTLRVRGSQPAANTTLETVVDNKIDTVQKKIVPGDTLQSFAIQYACTVSQLKQLNNLITEQDFFALRVIKVPIRRHGLLNELREEERRRPPTTLITNDYDLEDDDEDSDIRTISIGNTLRGDQSQAALFLKEMDQDLEKIRQSTLTQKDSLEEVVNTLTTKSIQPLQKKRKFLDGASCGITWWGIILTLVILVVLIPLGFCLYLYVTGNLKNPFS